MTGALGTRAERKRAQIESAARSLFLEQGYAGTTMDAVAAAAGVSKQTLYSYFASKTDLLAAILADELGTLFVAGGGAMSRVGTSDQLRDALLQLARSSVDRLMSEDAQQLLRLVIGEVFRLPELRDVVRELVPGRFLHGVEALLRAAADEGLVHAPRPELATRMLVGPLASFVTLDGLLRADGPHVPDDATLAYIVDAFLATIRQGAVP